MRGEPSSGSTSGTPPAKSGTTASPPCTTVALRPPSLSTTSQAREPIFGDGVNGQQGRFGREEEGQNAGSVGVRRTKWPILRGDVSQDSTELRRALLRARPATGLTTITDLLACCFIEGYQ